MNFLFDALASRGEMLQAEGISVDLQVPSESSPKAGMRLDASSERGLAQLVLWETGEADLTVADLVTGTIVLDEHRDVTSLVGIDDALDTIRAYLASPPPAEPDG